VEGATLQHLLRDEHALDFSSALRVLAPLAAALDYAHREGVIHRDIKPANIMVQPDGRPKLMDFGVARLDSSTATRSGRVLGSPSYMAPEQIRGEPPTPQADLFSLAVVAYETLTGRRPFPGDSVPAIVYRVVHEAALAPCSLNRELPAACDAVFARALAKNRDERYRDASAFVAALVGVDAGVGIHTISPDPLLQSLVSSGPAPAPVVASPTTTLNTKVAGLAEEGAAARRRRTQGAAATLAVMAAILVWFWVPLPRPSSPEAAVSGPLRIETQPAGMGVWIDGRHAGRSPLMLPLLPGTHQLRISEPGYAPAELSLQLNPGTTAAPLRFVMSPLTAARPERSPTPAKPRVSPAAETREGELVPLTASVQPPRRIAGRLPEYPEAARRLGLSGSVLIEMIVTERGEPEDIRVLESAGAILDETVVSAVPSWRFEPAVRGGVKVRVRWPYRHTFSPR
jgi:TonB family protein